jgi:adenylylsulfate reductase subunit A
MAAKQLVRYAKDHADYSPALAQSADELVDIVYKPVRTYLDHCEYSTADDINPNYIKPNGMMYRMMKAGHEYGAGTATFYQTTSKNLEIVMDMLETMREDNEKLAAGDLHELMRAWEIQHRIWTLESHLRHIQFRKETRYPGFYYQSDHPGTDDENWFCFVNSKYDPKAQKWDIFKKDYIKIFKD